MILDPLRSCAARDAIFTDGYRTSEHEALELGAGRAVPGLDGYHGRVFTAPSGPFGLSFYIGLVSDPDLHGVLAEATLDEAIDRTDAITESAMLSFIRGRMHFVRNVRFYSDEEEACDPHDADADALVTRFLEPLVAATREFPELAEAAPVYFAELYTLAGPTRT